MSNRIIQVSRPVVSDPAVLINVVATLENSLEAAQQKVKALREANDGLKAELAEHNVSLFTASNYGSDESESENEDVHDKDDRERVEDESSEGEGESEDGDTGMKGTSKSKEEEEEGQEEDEKNQPQALQYGGGKRLKHFYLKIMHRRGAVFQAKIEKRMLRQYSEIQIHTSEPRIVLKERVVDGA